MDWASRRSGKEKGEKRKKKKKKDFERINKYINKDTVLTGMFEYGVVAGVEMVEPQHTLLP